MTCPLSNHAPADLSADALGLRLPCCGNLRGSIPQHKADCARASANCPGCIYPGATHIAACRFGAACCVGVDVPESGWTHSADCPAAGDSDRQVFAEVPQVGASLKRLLDGEPPVPLAWRERDRPDVAAVAAASREFYLAKLVVAAQELAEVFRTPDGCFCCSMLEVGGKVEHLASCKAWHVLSLLISLAELELNPIGADSAAGGAVAGAGDGLVVQSSLGGLSEQVCLKCGARGGIWGAEERPEAEAYLALLGLNQCVGASATGKGHILYTHLCAGSFAAEAGGAQ